MTYKPQTKSPRKYILTVRAPDGTTRQVISLRRRYKGQKLEDNSEIIGVT